jgi:hypothetical protein
MGDWPIRWESRCCLSHGVASALWKRVSIVQIVSENTISSSQIKRFVANACSCKRDESKLAQNYISKLPNKLPYYEIMSVLPSISMLNFQFF